MRGARVVLNTLLAIAAAPDGRQYARRHGQGRSEEADREHEVPGVDGALASLEEHRSNEGVRGRERKKRPLDPRPG